MIYTDSKPTLFPTEEGAAIDPNADGLIITVPPTIDTELSEAPLLSPSEVNTATSTVSRPIRRKTMQEKELMKIYYQQIGPHNFPPRSEISARWRWAIKKVRSLYRLKSFKFGFTRQRLTKTSKDLTHTCE